MLAYFDEILAEQGDLAEENEGLGYFQMGAFFLGGERESLDESGLFFRREAMDGMASEGQGLSSPSALPGKSGSATVLPGEAGSATVMPGEAGSTAVVPGGAGTATVLPGEAGSATVMPGEAGSATVLPGGAGSATVLPGGAGSATVLPGEAGMEEVYLVEEAVEGLPLAVMPAVLEEKTLGMDFGKALASVGAGYGGLDGRREVSAVNPGEEALLGRESVRHGLSGLAQGDFPVVEPGVDRLLAESVMVMERQILAMRADQSLVSRMEWASDDLGELSREMVYQEGEASVLPVTGMATTWAVALEGRGMEEQLDGAGNLTGAGTGLDWREKSSSVLPSGGEGMSMGTGYVETATVRVADLGGDSGAGLLTQIRNLETATVGKGRLEREASVAVASGTGGISLGEGGRESAGVTVADFDRAVARDARRYDGI